MFERIFQAAFWFALCFAFVMASLPQPPTLNIDLSDKFMHMVAFAVLAGLIAPAYPRASLPVLFIGLAAFGGMIEIVQSIPTLNRTPSLYDWFADIIAAGVVLMLVNAIRSLRTAA